MKYGFIISLFIIGSALTGCMPNNVRIQTYDKQLVSANKTGLIAGLNKTEDKRPENQKKNDKHYEKPAALVVNEKLYRDLKLSGIFSEVFMNDFDGKKVDVVLDSSVNSLYYEHKTNGWTVFNFIFAFTGVPSLIYQLAGGPNGEHYGEANLELKMMNSDGEVLAFGSGDRKLEVNSNLHNIKTEGFGVIEGKALSDASFDVLESFSKNIYYSKLPNSNFHKSSNCGSDKDCKGDRICNDGKCVSPSAEIGKGLTFRPEDETKINTFLAN